MIDNKYAEKPEARRSRSTFGLASETSRTPELADSLGLGAGLPCLAWPCPSECLASGSSFFLDFWFILHSPCSLRLSVWYQLLLTSPALDCLLWSSSSCVRSRFVDWQTFELSCAELHLLYFASWAIPAAYCAPCTIVEDFSLGLLALSFAESDYAQFYLRFGSSYLGDLLSQSLDALPTSDPSGRNSNDCSDSFSCSHVIPSPPRHLIPNVSCYLKSYLEEGPVEKGRAHTRNTLHCLIHIAPLCATTAWLNSLGPLWAILLTFLPTLWGFLICP